MVARIPHPPSPHTVIVILLLSSISPARCLSCRNRRRKTGRVQNGVRVVYRSHVSRLTKFQERCRDKSWCRNLSAWKKHKWSRREKKLVLGDPLVSGLLAGVTMDRGTCHPVIQCVELNDRIASYTLP